MTATDDPLAALKDAAYVAVGFGVLGFQRAQVRRVELARKLKEERKRLEDQGGGPTSQLTALLAELDQRIDPVVAGMDEALDQVEGRVPESARPVVQECRTLVHQAREELRRLAAGGGQAS